MVNTTKKSGKKVFAVGTTATRALETAFIDHNTKGYRGYTKLFIYPGYKFKAVDRLITNFHLPESTLMILVSSFLGHEICMKTYSEAINRRFRFFSYGDAMIAIKSRSPSYDKNLGAN